MSPLLELLQIEFIKMCNAGPDDGPLLKPADLSRLAELQNRLRGREFRMSREHVEHGAPQSAALRAIHAAVGDMLQAARLSPLPTLSVQDLLSLESLVDQIDAMAAGEAVRQEMSKAEADWRLEHRNFKEGAWPPKKT